MTIDEIRDIFPFKSHYFRLKTHLYHYLDEGIGEPILLLHGNPTWSFLFRNIIGELSKTHRVIAPDHLGCGFSDKPQNFSYRLEMHIDNLEEFIHALNLKNITMLVHDWGGPIGLGIATRHPENIKRLIITNTAAFTMPRIPLRIAFCRLPLISEIMLRKTDLFCRCATLMTVAKPLPEKVRKGYLLPYNSPENRIAVYNFVKDIPMSYEDRSYETIIDIEHRIWMFKNRPVLLLWGMKDWCFNKFFLEKWAQFLPGASVVRIPEASHNLFEDSPEKVIFELKNFIKST